MLIAFISDVHANLPALKAAVADARTRGATRIICAGDLIGNAPFPNEVCDYLEKHKLQTISGNYDRKVLDVIREGESVIASLDSKKRELLLWTVERVKKPAQCYLEALPEEIECPLPGKRRLLLVHGSPVSNDDDVYPSITARGLAAKLGDRHPDILVCGHTHVPFVKLAGGVMVINCGSAGQPVDGDPRPAYALLSVDKSAAHARIIRFEYDVRETVAALKKTSLPKGLQKDFVNGTKRRFLQ